ncbi:MAG TPA: ATP-binding protein [Steroidobacteraceae bacterium]|nr:ATP-binding protein [Steroidobacteraceae bacterium]
MADPAPHDNESLAHAVRVARLRVAFEGQPSSITLAALLGTLTLAVLWSSSALLPLLSWYALFLVVTGARVALFRSHREHLENGSIADLERLQSRFVTLGCAAGASWGLTCVLVFPDEPLNRMFLAFVLAGSAAAAVTTLAALRASALGFVALCTLPLAGRLLLSGHTVDLAMGLMVLMFLAMVSVSITRLDAQLLALVQSRMEADEHLRARTAQQEQMQLLNDRLRLAIQAGQAGIFEWNIAENSISCDKHLSELYDLRDDGPFTYEVWRQRVHPLDLARVENSLSAALKGRGTFNEEFRVVWNDGTERVVKSAAIIERNAAGEATRLVGLNSNITELKRVDRMKSEFVSMVSHELRTPLTSIRAALGLISSGGVGAVPLKAQQLLQLANRNAERLGVLIDDMLDMEKIESGKLRFDLAPQPLLPIIEQSLEVNTAYATTHKVALTLAPAGADIIAAVDANRLLQVMTNLLSNAVKFSRADAQVDVSLVAEGTRATIEVRDYGSGIAPQFQSKVFTKFSQSDSSDARSKGGSGLGLAISKALIERMSGSISFRTSTGGTSFFIELPLRTAAGPIEDSERTTIVLPVSLA